MSVAPALGLRLPNSGPFAAAENIIRTATLAERLGYDSVWVHDHISWPREKLTHFATGSIEACRDQDPDFYESITTIGVLGGRTSRVRLGIAGLVLPLRDPRVLGKQLATLDRLTDGRIITAFGIGAIEGDFQVMGVRFDRRGRIMNDHLAALRAMYAAEPPTSFASPSLSFERGTFLPRPRGLRLWVTGASDAGIERAVKLADGWMTVYASVAEYAQAIGRLREAASREGRDPSTIETGYETYVCVARTHEEAMATARASLLHKFKTLERGLEVCIVGDADAAAERVEAYAAAGAGHIELKLICHSPEQLGEMAQRIAERMLAEPARS